MDRAQPNLVYLLYMSLAEHFKVGMQNLMTYDRYPIFLEAGGPSAAEHS